FTFVWASIVTRGLRFFLVAALLWRFGEPIRRFLEERLTLITRLFLIALVGGFVPFRYLFLDVDGPVRENSASQPARPARPAGQRRPARRRLLLPIRRGPRALRDVLLAALSAHGRDRGRARRARDLQLAQDRARSGADRHHRTDRDLGDRRLPRR